MRSRENLGLRSAPHPFALVPSFAAALVIMLAAAANATSVYQDRASFLSDLTSQHTIDFETNPATGGPWSGSFNGFNSESGLLVDDVGFSGPWAGGHWLFVANSTALGPSSFGHYLLGLGQGEISLRPPEDVNAIGFDYTVENGYSADVVFDVSFVSGSATEQFTAFSANQTIGFWGIASDTPISNLTFSTTTAAPLPRLLLDNFTHGSAAAPAPVPEPSTMLLLGTGLVGLARCRRPRTAA